MDKLNKYIGIALGSWLAIAAFTGTGPVKIFGGHAHSLSARGPCPGLGQVPASMINGAAQQLSISCRVVYQQINMESGGDPSSYSSAGAKGVAQFLQGTWDSHHCPGSPWNVNDSMNCYVVYMRELIGSEGSLRNALAAYNAGPGNLGAGYGYADSILSAAGQ